MAEFDLVSADAGDILERMLRYLMQAVGEPLYPGDERRIFAEAETPILVGLVNYVEDCARQNALTYARGEVLDALGERMGVHRLPGTPAETTLRFKLSEQRSTPTTIPAGTRAKTDTDVTFLTVADAVIPPEETSVDVLAQAAEVGEAGNGYLPDTVTTPVDKIPYIASVTNITATTGGSDGEGYDDDGDERFRERIRLAPAALSVAGPERAYEYWAKTADADIADVAIISEDEDYSIDVPVESGKVYLGGELLEPDQLLTVNGQDSGFSWAYKDWLLTITLEEELAREETVTVKTYHRLDGRVRIVPLMADGETPDDDVVQRIYDTCNAKDVRPMTDVIRVDKPVRVGYDISLEYWAALENESAVVEAVEGAGGAIERYAAEQDSRLGRDINPDVLKTMIMDAGALRVDITAPVHTDVGRGEAAQWSGEKTVSHHVETDARWD